MRQAKGEDKASMHPWKAYTAGDVRTLITGKLEETIEAGLIRWHEDEEVCVPIKIIDDIKLMSYHFRHQRIGCVG